MQIQYTSFLFRRKEISSTVVCASMRRITYFRISIFSLHRLLLLLLFAFVGFSARYLSEETAVNTCKCALHGQQYDFGCRCRMNNAMHHHFPFKFSFYLAHKYFICKFDNASSRSRHAFSITCQLPLATFRWLSQLVRHTNMQNKYFSSKNWSYRIAASFR